MPLFFLVFFLITLSACNNSKLERQANLIQPLETIAISLKDDIYKPDFRFGHHIMNHNDTLFVAYMDTGHVLQVYNTLTEKNEFSYSLKPFTQKAYYYFTDSDSSSIVFFDRDHKLLNFITFDYFNRKISNRLLDISHYKIFKDVVLSVERNSFAYNKDFFTLQYSTWNASENYMDTSAYLLFKIEDSVNPSTVAKRLFFDETIRDEKVRNNYTQLTKIKGNEYAYFFNCADNAYLINLESNNILKHGILPKINGYKEYDKKKFRDLSYENNLIKTTEENLQSAYCNGNLWILKRLERKDIFEKPEYRIIKLDMNFKVISYYSLDYIPSEMVTFEKKIVILNSDFSKLSIYD